MRGVLVSLPLQDPSVPPLGLALLAAALEEQHVAYAIEDANGDFLQFALGENPFTPQARQSSSGYLAAHRRLQDALRRHSEGALRLRPFQIDHALWPDLRALRRAANDGLWRRWVGAGIVGRILRHEPDWVGLSVCFEGQIVPALALGAALKGRAFVIWGGGLLNAFRHVLTEETPLWDAADAAVLGAGEQILARMRRTAAGLRPPGGCGLRMVPGGWIAWMPGLEKARRPAFGRMPRNPLGGPERVLPYRVFSRCHWRRCAFCADARYRAHQDRLGGDPRAVSRELLRMRDQDGARGVYFLDAELPAAFAAPLAACLRGGGVLWGGNARLDAAFARDGAAENLYAGGCRFLRFGLESASSAVLRRMRKGVCPSVAANVLRAVSQAGIGVHVYLMEGFPGETAEDRMATRRFLLAHRRHIDSYNISTFALYEGAPLLSALPPGAVIRDARPDHWSTPRLADPPPAPPDQADLEHAFYSGRGPTRCFPTTGDSILLGERFLLNYGDA